MKLKTTIGDTAFSAKRKLPSANTHHIRLPFRKTLLEAQNFKICTPVVKSRNRAAPKIK